MPITTRPSATFEPPVTWRFSQYKSFGEHDRVLVAQLEQAADGRSPPSSVSTESIIGQ